jgi:hypothetical protein
MTTPYKNLDLLDRWAHHYGAKTAFVAPGGMPMPGAPPVDPAAMGMPPGGAPPIDPALMGMPPGGAPMDPMGAPPMDMAAMGMPPAPPPPPAPPADPGMQTMSNQEGMRSLIREEIQKAMGSTDAGPGVASPSGAKKGDKFESAIAQLKDQNDQQLKVIVMALRKAGMEIPLADILGMENPDQSQQGVSETLQPGQGGTNEGSLVAKAAAFEADVDRLVKLAETRDMLKRSAMSHKLVSFDPWLPEKNYFAGLYR